MKRTVIGTIGLLLALGACGSGSDEQPAANESVARSTTSEPTDVMTLTASLKAAVPEISKVVVYTEDTDPNDLLGRPNGYTQAAVLIDSRTNCDESDLGVSCGAVLEMWPSADEAKGRSEYIQSALKDNPMLGTEYNYLRGANLLRVTGELKPSDARAIQEAWATLD